MWATSPLNTCKVMEAFLGSDNTILVFSLSESGRFCGYARVESLPIDDYSAQLFGGPERRSLGLCFPLRWLNVQTLSFDKATDALRRCNIVLPTNSTPLVHDC